MLSAAENAGDPNQFRETELFQKCLELRLIPRDEAELALQWAPVESGREQHSSSPRCDAPTSEKKGIRLILCVSGMWCPICAWVIEETLKKLPGVYNPSCIFSNDTLICHYNPVEISPSIIIEKIKQLGYVAHAQDIDIGKQIEKTEFVRLCISTFLSMNIMMLSFSLYFGFFDSFSTTELQVLSWPVAVMATVVFFYCGHPIHRQAYSAIKTGYFGMETLISIGATSAYGYSVYNFPSGSLHLYFDTAAMLITLTLLGRWLECRARERIGRNLSSLFALRPAKARICSPEFPNGRYVSASFLKAGDTFQLETGDIIPADGTIQKGNALVDESNLSGEALPKAKGEGDLLRSGTRMISGELRVRAERVGNDGTLGQMLSLIERTLSQKAPIENISERYLRWFVPFIIGLAFITGMAWWYSGVPLDTAIIRSVTVLVVSCPCALGVAVPLARVAGISVIGSKGILVRSFSAFEKVSSLNAAVFDKTGTITEGRWRLKEIHPIGSFDPGFLLGMAAGLECHSSHLIASEIRRLATEKEIKPVLPDKIEAYSSGVTGKYKGKTYALGSLSFVREKLNCNVNSIADSPGGYELTSRIYLGVEGRLIGEFIFGDSIRTSAFPTIQTLRDKGFEIVIVSGDDEQATAAVAKKVEISTFFSSRSPEDKVDIIKQLQEKGWHVAMIGDGINDAPALARSDLSVAVFSGNQLSEETADISLMSGDLQRLLVFLSLAKKVRNKIRMNLVLTFLYNIIAIPISMAGLLSPIVAVCAMLLSSLSVIGNTLLLIRAPAEGKSD